MDYETIDLRINSMDVYDLQLKGYQVMGIVQLLNALTSPEEVPEELLEQAAEVKEQANDIIGTLLPSLARRDDLLGADMFPSLEQFLTLAASHVRDNMPELGEAMAHHLQLCHDLLAWLSIAVEGHMTEEISKHIGKNEMIVLTITMLYAIVSMGRPAEADDSLAICRMLAEKIAGERICGRQS